MLDPAEIKALTFDCYGTLVDWETGILAAAKDVLARHHVKPPSDAELLSLYAELEAKQESGNYRPYREVLAATIAGIATRQGIPDLPRQDRDALAESLPRWAVFPDTCPFLARASRRYSLCICSNIDDDLWRGTRRAIDAPLDWVVTAQFCRSYKPNPRHFRVALALLGLQAHQVLHVAESRRHDIEPAKRLGFQTVWVNRHNHRPGPSASGHGEATADFEVDDLQQLAETLGLDAPIRPAP